VESSGAGPRARWPRDSERVGWPRASRRGRRALGVASLSRRGLRSWATPQSPPYDKQRDPASSVGGSASGEGIWRVGGENRCAVPSTPSRAENGGVPDCRGRLETWSPTTRERVRWSRNIPSVCRPLGPSAPGTPDRLIPHFRKCGISARTRSAAAPLLAGGHARVVYRRAESWGAIWHPTRAVLSGAAHGPG